MNNKIIFNKTKRLNFISTCMIVLLHSNCLNLVRENQNIAQNAIGFCSALADMAVPIFFCMSAFLFYRNYKQNEYIKKLTRRIKSIVIPYFIWSFLLWLVYAIMYSIPNVNKYLNITEFSFAVGDVMKAIFFAEYNTPLWFLRVLFIYVVCAPVIFSIVRRKIVGIVTILSCLILNFFVSIPYSSPFFWIHIYMLGAWLAIHYCEKCVDLYVTKLQLILVGVAFLLLLVIAYLNNGVWYTIYRFISPVVAWMLLIYDGDKCYKIERHSFLIFCSHNLVVRIVKGLLIKFLGTLSEIKIIVLYFLTAILAIILIGVLGSLIERYWKKMYLLVTGGRADY